MSEQLQARTSKHQFGYRLSVLSDVGRKRSENQDAFGYAVSSQAALYMVADGMGGARGGATASALAVNYIIDHAFDQSLNVDMESLRTAIAGSNSVIFSRSQEDPNLFGMGTTIASLLIAGNTVTLAHVGDSRVYCLAGNEFSQLTRDHTLVQELVDTGTIAENDAAAHPIAHMLTRSLGPAEIIGVEVKAVDKVLKGGERFLICSDGLYNHVPFQRIRELLEQGTPEEVAKNLIKHALDGGGSDNVTALVLEVTPAQSGPGNLELPQGDEVIRVASRPSPEVQVETETDQDKWQPAAKANGVDGHETTGFLKADDLAAYAKAHQETIAASRAKSLPEKEKPRAFPVIVMVLGVLAGIYFFSRGSSEPEKEIELASHHPDAPSSGELPIGQPTTSPAEALSRATPEISPPPLDTPIAEATSSHLIIPENTPEQPTPVSSLSEQATEAPLVLATPQVVLPVTPESSPLPPPTPEQAVLPIAVAVESTLSQAAKAADAAQGIPVELVSRALAIEVGAPPELSGVELEKIPELSANSPIVWEHESQRMARILAEDRARRVNDASDLGKGPRGIKPKLFAPTELQAAAQDKENVRRRIAELDGKITLLLIPDKATAKKEALKTEKKLAQLKKAIQTKQQELNRWEQVLQSWRLVKDQSISTDTTQLAVIAEKFSPSIRDAHAAYKKASETYTSALGKWQNQALDTQATAMLAQLGRDVKARRLELENSVRTEVNRGFLEADDQVTRGRIELFGLEREKDLLVKYAGYINGYAPVSAAGRITLYRKYLSERAKNIKRLKELQQTLDDDAEVTFRVREFSKGVNKS